MARYRYQRGDKPLEGFTIEHGLGVGGFGEVYYATSDSGREVALKAVQNYEEIELRGIRHCMNLKSPHLVTIFDVRHNARRDPFVIMEFVQGPSLRRLLDEAPEGLGATKAAFFLREIAKGLTYLHDAGVVHRDLKPHNVFYEEGFVKIGDYSLCKLISTTHHTGHTMTVGTVHYMAPEISKGRYDASVDIYALGVMLYEMLTGLPPFTGDSIGEILMKHMTEEPDLSNIEEPFRAVLAKALQKSPEARFQSAEEMVAAVFGTEHVQNSVVAFNPKELTLVAEKVGENIIAGAPADVQSPTSGDHHWGPEESPLASARQGPPDTPRVLQEGNGLVGEGVKTVSGLMGWRSASRARLSKDPMPAAVRYALAVGVAFVLSLFVDSTFARSPFLGSSQQLMLWMGSFAGTTIVCFSVLRSKVLRHLAPEARFASTLSIDLMLTLLVIPLGMGVVPLLLGLHAGPVWEGGAITLLLALIPIGMFDWHRTTHPLRAKRLHFTQICGAVGLSWIFALFAFRLNQDVTMIIGPAITATIAMGLQITSPLQRQLPEKAGHLPTMDYRDDKLASAQGLDSDDRTPELERDQVTAASSLVIVPQDASPFARWPLLGLAGTFFLVPIFGGLQRLYVGKRSSGLIWMFTLGLAGLGQLFDIIKIVRGEFLDAEGRPVLAWETSQAPSTSVNQLSSVPPQGHADAALRSIASILGSVLFTASAMLAGIALTLQFAAYDNLGGVDYETVVVVSVVGIGLLIGSCALLISGRRGLGLLSKLRVVAATLVVGSVLAMVTAGNSRFLLPFQVFLLPVAMILFAWPSRSKQDEEICSPLETEVLV